MPERCLPSHLRGKSHDDWLWPFSEIPRSFNALCGTGPNWREVSGYQSRPIPLPGFKSATWTDRDGSWRPYWAATLANGWHIRFLCRWDDVDKYYNLLPVSFGFEYKDGEPI